VQTVYGRSSSTSEGSEAAAVRVRAPRLRADARRNRDQLLAAARDVFVEQGAGAPLDDVARRAGVGIATLYRRFPDRASLMRAVALDVLERVGAQARQALIEEPDALLALTRYMHRTLDLGIAAVMPAIVGSISSALDADAAIQAAREAATEPVQRMIEQAQVEGTLRPDVSFGDIDLMLIRLSRPLPGAYPPELDASLAHRHVDLLLQGLRARSDGLLDRLSGPALSLDDLRQASPTHASGIKTAVPMVGRE
jgi:AcrR family transcriptional regulator